MWNAPHCNATRPSRTSSRRQSPAVRARRHRSAPAIGPRRGRARRVAPDRPYRRRAAPPFPASTPPRPTYRDTGKAMPTRSPIGSEVRTLDMGRHATGAAVRARMFAATMDGGDMVTTGSARLRGTATASGDRRRRPLRRSTPAVPRLRTRPRCRATSRGIQPVCRRADVGLRQAVGPADARRTSVHPQPPRPRSGYRRATPTTSRPSPFPSCTTSGSTKRASILRCSTPPCRSA
jgi:hypothetical protein